MKIVTAFLLLFFIHSASGQYTTVKFDKVIMYDFKAESEGEDIYIVNAKGVLAKNIAKQIELTKQDVRSLNSKVENKKSYGEATAPCFNPHLGLVYYLKDKIVAHITVSLECNRLHSSIEIAAQKQGKVSISTDIYYTGTGLSKSFKAFINSLLHKYNFSHQLNNP